MSLTSYVGPAENDQLADPLHLLDLEGLRQIVAFLDALQMKGRATEPSPGR
jgi:hypothetical protein